jgi:hypothetical protein
VKNVQWRAVQKVEEMVVTWSKTVLERMSLFLRYRPNILWLKVHKGALLAITDAPASSMLLSGLVF